ncbi:MAG: exosortase/archaeosortase family protein [Verrucomicrobia bacterium]|nr:exosortase/archaeosortase family protein [Verrucomicrobiota bacterium]
MSEEKTSAKGASESFQEEFLACWRRLPDKLLFAGLAALWCALFHFRGNAVFGWVDTSSLFGWMYWAFSTWPDDGHGLLVPFVVLGLFWWNRQELLSLPKGIWWPALSLVVFGLLLHLLGYRVQQTRISIVAFFVGLYGLTGLVWGWRWLKSTFFPMVLFGFCVPIGGMADAVTVPLRMLVAQVSVGFANVVLGIPVIRDGTQIAAEGIFKYEVAAACSGIRSLVALLAMTTIYGFVAFRPAWKRTLVILSAIPLAVLGNIVRITGVIVTGDAFGHNAGVFVEQKLGFVTFAVAIGCVLLLGHWLRDEEGERQVAV